LDTFQRKEAKTLSTEYRVKTQRKLPGVGAISQSNNVEKRTSSHFSTNTISIGMRAKSQSTPALEVITSQKLSGLGMFPKQPWHFSEVIGSSVMAGFSVPVAEDVVSSKLVPTSIGADSATCLSIGVILLKKKTNTVKKTTNVFRAIFLNIVCFYNFDINIIF